MGDTEGVSLKNMRIVNTFGSPLGNDIALSVDLPIPETTFHNFLTLLKKNDLGWRWCVCVSRGAGLFSSSFSFKGIVQIPKSFSIF